MFHFFLLTFFSLNRVHCRCCHLYCLANLSWCPDFTSEGAGFLGELPLFPSWGKAAVQHVENQSLAHSGKSRISRHVVAHKQALQFFFRVFPPCCL